MSFYVVNFLPQGSLTARTLHTPQGILSGFGRRVSSLFFGSAGGDQSSVEGRSITVLDSHSGTSWLGSLTPPQSPSFFIIIEYGL